VTSLYKVYSWHLVSVTGIRAYEHLLGKAAEACGFADGKPGIVLEGTTGIA
jgi:hypothetical protein